MSEAPASAPQAAASRPDSRKRFTGARIAMKVGLVAILLGAGGLLWLQFRGGVPIAEIQADPALYNGKTVTVRGTVTEASELPLVGAGYLLMGDDGEKILVHGGQAPEEGRRVKVRGTVKVPVNTRFAKVVYIEALPAP